MKKGKRLLVMLLATLVVVTGAFSVAYATSTHDITGLGSASGANNRANVLRNTSTIGTVEVKPNSNLVYDGTTKDVQFAATVSAQYYTVTPLTSEGCFQFNRTYSDTGISGYVEYDEDPIQYEGATAAGETYSSTTAPTDAGSYTATATLRAYNSQRSQVGTRSISTSFTISKMEITPEWSGDSFTYNGQEQVPELTFKSEGTTVDVPTDAYEVTYTKASDDSASVASPTDADSYTATVTLLDTSNYKLAEGADDTYDFTIDPKPIPVVWGSNTTFVYDGQNHAPSVSIDPNRIVSGDQVDVTAAGEKTAEDHTATAVLTGTDKTNYVITEATKTKDYVISPKPLTVTWKGVGGDPRDFDFVYNGEQQGPTAELDKSGIVRGESCDIVVTGQQTNVGIYDGGTGDGHGPKASATLTNTNYVIAEGQDEQEFEIQEFTIVKLFWDPETLEYNADYQHPEATVSDSATDEPIDPLDCGLTYTVYKNSYAPGNRVQEGAKMPVGTYVVVANLDSSENNFKFAPGTPRSFEFRVTPKEVEVALDIEDTIYYDADYHKPEITATGIFSGDDCRPAVSLKGQTLDSEAVNIPDCNDSTLSRDKTGVIHASSGKYTAKVEALVGEDSTNYVLKANTQKKFEIKPKTVTLDWYRPANNAYGEYLDTTGQVTDDVTKAALVKTTGSTPKIVFNGKEQAPIAEVKEGMLETNAVTGVIDECIVTVSAPKEAVEAGIYTVTDIDFSNPDYTRQHSGQKYQIVKRPVKLEWDKYYTAYNGKEQERKVDITNIQKDEYGADYTNKKGVVVGVSEILYSEGKHFGTSGEDEDEPQAYIDEPIDYITYDDGDKKVPFPDVEATDGSDIDEGRIIIDAGTRTMTAGDLTDTFNYTYDKLTGDTVTDGKGEGTNDSSDEKVDLYDTLYIIHQHKIAQIAWSNSPVTYNASNQKPVAEVSKSDLQGPDTVKEVVVMIHDDPMSKNDDFAGKCNAGTYTIYVLKNSTFRGIKGGEEVDRSMNYRIEYGVDGGSEVVPTENLDSKFVINKKALTVTVYNKTGYYGDDPASYKHTVKYTGLVNGDVNTDDNHQNKNIPGKYTPDEGEEKDVVEGTLKFTTNYKKWGKPGTYSIKASGLTSDNYAIKYVDGKLTIKDRLLAGDLVAKVKAGNKKGTISWTGVKDAAKYQIYFSLCNTETKKYTPKLYKTFGANTRSFTVKKLKKNTYYKFYVVALDSKGNRIAKTEEHHFCTNNVFKKWTNPKTIKASKTKVSLKKGQTFKLSAKVTKVKAGKKLTNGKHTSKVRYRSATPQVATVSNGTIKATGSGWCRIYVMAANGIWQVVEVTVQ